MSVARRKGTRQESRLVAWLRKQGLDAERVPLRGVHDAEDVRIRRPPWPDLLIQVKWRHLTSAWSLASWVDRLVQREHDAAVRMLVVPVPGRQLGCAVAAWPASADMHLPPWWSAHVIGLAATTRSLLAELDRVATIHREAVELCRGAPAILYRRRYLATRLDVFVRWLDMPE